MTSKIGVGIIGANPDRGWAAWAHIPALKSLPDFEIRALSTSRRDSAQAAGKLFGVPLCFDNHAELVHHPEVDLVVITVKVPHHLELVTAALTAGKAVYCEWPLGNGIEETIEMARLAREKNVLGVVGLQARSAPAINYVRDVIAEGYIGEVLSTTLVGSGMNWGPVIEEANAYTADARNGATLLSIPLGHTIDALCYCLGEFDQLSATTAIRRKTFSISETGVQQPMTTPDQICIDGLLSCGAAVSVHYRGGVSRGTNLLWEINGTEGDLQITAAGGHAQMFELTVAGGRGSDTGLQALPVPANYRWSPPQPAPGFAFNVAQAYGRLARDWHEGTHLCPTFDDAVNRHRLLQAIESAASTGLKQRFIGTAQ